jgi:hypothetical protein
MQFINGCLVSLFAAVLISLPGSASANVCGSTISRFVVPDYVCFDVQGNRVPFSVCEKGRGQGSLVRYKVDLSAACTAHDTCYATGGSAKDLCDSAFFANMKAACRDQLPRELGEKAFSRCIDTVLSFNDAVRGELACKAYKSAQEKTGNKQSSCDGKSSFATDTTPTGSPSLTGAQKSAVETWLAGNKGYRIAVLGDCQCESDMPFIRRTYSNDHPYFVEGDFNGDGHLDFAIVVIDTKAPTGGPPPRYFNSVILVFEGPLTKSTKAAFVSHKVGTPLGAQLFYTAADEKIIVGKWESSATPLVRKASGYSLK